MTLSENQLKDINSPQNKFYYMMLVEVTKFTPFEGNDQSIIRMVDNNEDVTSNGVLFQATPFKYELPDIGDKSRGIVGFSIPNNNNTLIPSLRSLNTGNIAENKLRFDFNLISSENLDLSLLGNIDLLCDEISFNEQEISFSLSNEFLSDISYPFFNFIPGDYAALF